MSIHSVLIQKLLNTNAHIGRRVTTNHFKIFSDGTRNSVSIIDSDKTLICLRNACNFIGQLARSNARFLFVNTNPVFDEIINQMTHTVAIKNDTTWRLGGFLTNSLSPKRFKGRNKKFNLSAIVPPDCIVIFDAERKSSVIQEAYKLQIPIVGLVDSSMPWETFKKITYPVPANDSVEFVYLFCNLITKTILKEKKERKAAKEDKSIELREKVQQDSKTIPKDKIIVFPYENLLDVSEDISETKKILDKLFVLKFNGDLGTKVGFNGPKSAIEIGSGLTYLDLIVNHIEAINAKYGCNIPLLLVNSIITHDGISKVLEKHPNKNIYSVVQSQDQLQDTSYSVPRKAKKQDDQDEMDSFNLAEVFLPLMESGKLEILLSQGKEYILLLSSDNVAHVIDPKILSHMIQNNINYCLEVMPKSSNLEESNISPSKEDTQTVTPRKNWKFSNTMWMKIDSIVRPLVRRASIAEEHLTFSVSELEDQFALGVPKSRYLPVEAASDLFLLQSDLYNLTDGNLTKTTSRENSADPNIEFGSEFENVNDLRMRFKSIPSVLELKSLKVTGDVWFGTGIILKGNVEIHAREYTKIVIPDNTVLENAFITKQKDIGGES